MTSDDTLSRLAEAALLQEAKRGASRAELAGPSGWLKPKLAPTNKLFLHNTIRGALAANQVKDSKMRKTKESRLERFERELKERKRYKKQYLRASTKVKETKPSPSTGEGSSSRAKVKSVNGVAWSDEGLEISCAISTVTKKKKVKGKICDLPTRRINFVSGSKTSKLPS